MAKHGNKETLMITLNPDVKEMIQKQAAEKNLSVSNYVERFVLEKDYEARMKNENK